MGYWDNVTPNSVANADDGFKEFKIGENEAYVKSVTEKESESGNPMLVITFANDEGAEIRHFIVDGEWKLTKLKQFYLSCGIPMGNMDVRSWIGKRCIVVCKPGKPYKDKVYNQVSYLMPLIKSSFSQGTPNNSVQKTQPAAQSTQPTIDSKYGPGGIDDPGDPFEDDIPF